MKSFWVALLSFILKMVDVSVSLDGDILTIILELGSIKVLDLHLDLIKDGPELSTDAVRSAFVKNSKFASDRVK
jgi:hypothetical protein